MLDAVQRLHGDPTQRIHVAVLDETLDGMGGLQVARVLHETPHAPPVILLSDAAAARNLLQQALALRVFSVLNKPVELNALLDVLARVVRRHYGNRWPGLPDPPDAPSIS